MIKFILKNNISNKLYTLGFVVAIISYSLWQPLEGMMQLAEDKSGSIFYIGIAFSFCCYTSAYLFTKWDKWRWFPLFVVLICIGRLLSEVLFAFDKEPDVEIEGVLLVRGFTPTTKQLWPTTKQASGQ